MITRLDTKDTRLQPVHLRNLIQPALIIAVWAGLLPITASSAAPYYYLTLETAITQQQPPLSTWTGTLVDNLKIFPIYEQNSWHQFPFISSTMSYRGMRSLGFTAYAAPNNLENVSDRGEVALSLANGDHALTFGLRQYVRFAFCVGVDSQSPQNWMIMHQVWQQTNTYSPPFAIWVRPNADASAPIILDFQALDDNHVRIGEIITFFSVQIEKGRWYDLTIQLQPSYNGDAVAGQIAVWIDRTAGIAAPNFVWYQDWGYAPETVGGAEGNGNAFDIRVGLYRREQARYFTVFFDEIKIGPTADSVK